MSDRFQPTDHQLAIQDVARRFTADRIRPSAAEWDPDKHFPGETIKADASGGQIEGDEDVPGGADDGPPRGRGERTRRGGGPFRGALDSALALAGEIAAVPPRPGIANKELVNAPFETRLA
jgi:hypothetical protein